MNKKNIIQIAVFVVSLGLCIWGTYNIYSNAKEVEALEHKSNRLSQQANNTQEEFDQHKDSVQETAYEEAQEGDDQEAKDVAEYNSSYAQMNTIAQEFFETYFTWNDSEEYQERKENVDAIISDDLKNNKEIFDDGKDNTGGDYIEGTGVKSEFSEAEAYPVDTETALVKVTYQSWFEDGQGASGQSTRYYEVQYGENQQQINQLRLVFSTDDD